ncbi:MAG: alpha/beta hydrolase [Candidatus Xenobia bacterium]
MNSSIVRLFRPHYRCPAAAGVAGAVKLSRVRLSERVSALHYEPDRPSGVRVVLTHGVTSCAASLDLLSAYLVGHRFEVLALDLPGHTLGCSGGELRGFEDAVACIRLAVQGRGPVVAGGHSFGGAASLVAAAAGGIDAVFAIAVGVPRGPRGTVASAMRDARTHYVQGAPLDALMREMNAALSSVQIACPMLAVGARRDAVVAADGVEAWPERVPGAVVEWVDSMHLDAPAAARAVVGRWLDQFVRL